MRGAWLFVLVVACAPPRAMAPAPGPPPEVIEARPSPPPAGLQEWRQISTWRDFEYGAELRWPLRRRGGEVVQAIESDYDAPITLRFAITRHDNLAPAGPTRAAVVVPPRGRLDLVPFSVIEPSAAVDTLFSFTAFVGAPEMVPAAYAYALPLPLGTKAEVLQGFGGDFSHQPPTQHAIDLRLPIGTPVRAMRPGRVVAQHEAVDGPLLTEDGRDYEHMNFVAVLHDDGTVAEYLHLAQDGVHVETGAEVERGQVIASSGNTGYSTEPHLHVHVGSPGPTADAVHTVAVDFALAPDRLGVPRRGDVVIGWE